MKKEIGFSPHRISDDNYKTPAQAIKAKERPGWHGKSHGEFINS